MPRPKKTQAGKLSIAQMRNLINKKAGINVAHDLSAENPTEVKQWIPTGSRWLDSLMYGTNICRALASRRQSIFRYYAVCLYAIGVVN